MAINMNSMTGVVIVNARALAFFRVDICGLYSSDYNGKPLIYKLYKNYTLPFVLLT